MPLTNREVVARTAGFLHLWKSRGRSYNHLCPLEQEQSSHSTQHVSKAHYVSLEEPGLTLQMAKPQQTGVKCFCTHLAWCLVLRETRASR